MGVYILVDTGTTHNIIDINVARLIGLGEQRIDTTILVSSGNEVSCWATSFNVPLHVDAEVFHIDAFLLNIGNDIDIILGMPWLVSQGRLTWDFTTMELLYYNIDHPITFTTMGPQHRLTMVLALLPHTPIQRATREHQAPPSPPRDIIFCASRSRCPTDLDQL